MRKIREILIKKLWDGYIHAIPNHEKFTEYKPVLDHLAIIDVTSENSNRLILQKILSRIGYTSSGAGFGYLPEKLNDFLWMYCQDSANSKADEALPQLVFADFRIEGHSKKVQDIVRKYVQHQKPFNFIKLDQFIANDDHKGAAQHIYDFITSRHWDLPTVGEFTTVKDENQLMAWALLFGKRVNHFGLNVTFEPNRSSLANFNEHLKSQNLAEINNIDGEVKGNQEQGIQQSSTVGRPIKYKLADGEVEVNDSFMEFVWRFPRKENPIMWGDYFTGFVAQNANKVIESLYEK